MKNQEQKVLDLIIGIERFNQEYKAISNEISNKTNDCWMEKYQRSDNFESACLTDWLEKKYEIDYRNCPVTGREHEIKIPYWTAPQKTEKDCPHCYAALKLIEERKAIKQKRGRLKAQLTKIAKRELLNRGVA